MISLVAESSYINVEPMYIDYMYELISVRKNTGCRKG